MRLSRFLSTLGLRNLLLMRRKSDSLHSLWGRIPRTQELY